MLLNSNIHPKILRNAHAISKRSRLISTQVQSAEVLEARTLLSATALTAQQASVVSKLSGNAEPDRLDGARQR